MEYTEDVNKKYKELYNGEPIILRSPGRINLIGEHTDYNMGFVLPGAIDKAIIFAIACRNDEICNVFSLDKNDSFQFNLNELVATPKAWPNYLMGVVDQLQKAGYKINGFNCVFGGDIPIGAGLSSSAALEAGLAFALNYIFTLNIDNLSIVKLSQKAENEFVGVKCGIMDQFVNIFGKAENVLQIDCRSLEYEYYPFSCHNVSIVLFDTCISHSLASSEYNKRRQECAEGVRVIRNKYSNIDSLRDVSIAMLNEFKSSLDELIYKRCKYVVEENNRVIEACYALKDRDLKKFGWLMYQTHQGLSKEYEVSCKELDYLVELATQHKEIYGARMMGGGFGGCSINLVENEGVERIVLDITSKYKSNFGKEPKVYVTSINSGTHIISDN